MYCLKTLWIDSAKCDTLSTSRERIPSKKWHYKATQLTTTGKAPAELLVNCKYTVHLPELQVPVHNPKICQRNVLAKAKQKAYKDSKMNTKNHNIQVNDKVLWLYCQSKSRYDPVPYRVVKVQGTQITVTCGDQVRKRDAEKFTCTHPQTIAGTDLRLWNTMICS